MTTTGRGLGWPPPDSASRGNWNGKPDVGLGWPARPSRAGRTAFAVPGSAAAWHPPPGAGPTTPVGASAAFPGAITEVRPFAGISATGGQAAPAGPVRGYARPVVGGNGNAASSAAPERTRSVGLSIRKTAGLRVSGGYRVGSGQMSGPGPDLALLDRRPRQPERGRRRAPCGGVVSSSADSAGRRLGLRPAWWRDDMLGLTG